MFVSSLDSKSKKVINNGQVESKITKFSLNGPFLELEGYAAFYGIKSFSEDEIRKTLMFVKKINIEEYRKKMFRNLEEEREQPTDEEIIKQNTIEYALDNCKFSELESHPKILREDLDPLSGFKAILDLSTINHGQPLTKGEYNIYLKLEQLSPNNHNIKYEKVIPLSNTKQFIQDRLLQTKIEHYTSTKVSKYSLIFNFNKYYKTLNIKNTLLQSYNPKEVEIDSEKKEPNTVKSIKRKFFKLFYIIFCVLPIKNNKIVFASDSRTELNGNFYFIYEELYKRNMDLKIKFLLHDRIDNKKTLLDLVKIAFHFATAKIILLDDFYPLVYPLRIRKNADLIQVWHAAGAFKTFGFSRVGRPGGPSIHSKNHKNYTKVVVSSEGVRHHYAEGFGISIDKIYPLGVPRSDIFFDEEYKKYVRKVLLNKYPFLKNKKVILFAPTFRGNGQSSAHFPFEVLNLKLLYQRLHKEYVFLFKIHPFVNNELSIPYEYSDFFYDFSGFREINDLLLITDILITDYSSVCFEFALLDKPMIFFGFDVEKYIQERDFYYDYFEFIPGTLVKTTEEIVEVIEKGNFNMEKIQPFVNYFFNDDLGNASKNVVDHVIIPSLEKRYEKVKKKFTILPPPKSRIELFERTLEKSDEEAN